MRHSTPIIACCMLVVALFVASPARAGARVPLGHVEVRGEGPVPMVLIAGPTLDWRYWESFMERNGDAYTMYAVTLPGMSGTEAMPMPPLWRPPELEKRKNPPLDTPWLDNAVDAITDMMQEHELENAVVMGHALGGVLALRLGIERPGLVGAVISLEGTVAFPMAQQVSKKDRAYDAQWVFDANLREISPEEWPDRMAEWTSYSVSDPDIADFVNRVSLDTDREVAIRYMVEHRMTDLTNEMTRLKAPTLAIFSESTGRSTKYNSLKRREFGPAWHEEVRFYPFEDISFFYNLKQPERFDAEIAAFVKAQGVGGAEANEN